MTDLNLMQEAPLWKDLYLPQVADVVGVHRKIIVPANVGVHRKIIVPARGWRAQEDHCARRV